MPSVVAPAAVAPYPLVENEVHRSHWIESNEAPRVVPEHHRDVTECLPIRQFACLYTKHKTQKHKLWSDGRLVVSSSSSVTLYAADPAPGSGDPVLERMEMTRSEIDALLRHQRSESEQYLITIEGPWMMTTTRENASQPAPLVSSGMQKVLSKKFQKPSHKPPPPPLPSHREPKRRRPLQPGELVQQYYGVAAPPPLSDSSEGAAPRPQRSGHTDGMAPSPQPRYHSLAQREYHRHPPAHHSTQPSRSFQQNVSDTTSESFRMYSNLSLNPSDDTERPHPSASARPTIQNPSCHVALPIVAPRAAPSVVLPSIAPHQNTNTSSFVSNAFNANHFYGDEEDLEEDDADGAPEAFALETADPLNATPEAFTALETMATLSSTTLPRNKESTDSNNNNVGQAKLSNTQLLDLFQFSSFSDAPNTTTYAAKDEDEFVLPPSNDEEDDNSTDVQ